MFSSKLTYGITVWGRIWNIPGSLDEEALGRTSQSLTKEDLRKLQVFQNKHLKIVTNSDYKTFYIITFILHKNGTKTSK